MKKVRVVSHKMGGVVTITAPEGKEMVFDAGLLAHGILVLGEYGPSGKKIIAFKEWDVANFEADGYEVEGEAAG